VDDLKRLGEGTGRVNDKIEWEKGRGGEWANSTTTISAQPLRTI